MKPHPTDLVSFIPGVIAVAVAVVALAGGLTVDALATDWVWPAVLVGLGLLVLASAGLGPRSSREPDADAQDGQDPATTPDAADDETFPGPA